MTRFLALFSALVLVLTSVGAQAQAPGGQPASGQPQKPMPTRVATIDLNKVFKEYVRYQSLKANLENEVKAAEADLQNRKQRLADMIETLKGYKPGSPEYKNLDEQIAAFDAESALMARSMRKQFDEKQAANLYAAYTELQGILASYCDRYGIAVVLRVSANQADKTNVEEMTREVNKIIVYNAGAINITEHILQALNQNNTARPAIGPNAPRKQ